MAKTAIGLDVTPSNVRAAVIRFDSKSTTITALAEQPLYPGAVTSGGVADVESLAGAIKALWSTNRIKGNRVILGLGGQRVVVRAATIPWMAPKDIRAALPLYVSEVVPFDVNEAVLDYVISGEDTNDEGDRLYTGILAGTALEYVTEMVDAVQAANLRVVAVDVAAFALLRAVVPPIPPGFLVCEAVINIGHQSTQVVVHVNGRPELVRDLPLGSDSAAAPYPGYVADPTAPPHSIEPLVEELNTTLGFYQSGDDAVPLQRVLLVGSGALLPGLDLALSSGLNLPVAHDAVWLTMARDRSGASDEAVRLLGSNMAVAVGLALGATV